MSATFDFYDCEKLGGNNTPLTVIFMECYAWNLRCYCVIECDDFVTMRGTWGNTGATRDIRKQRKRCGIADENFVPVA